MGLSAAAEGIRVGEIKELSPLSGIGTAVKVFCFFLKSCFIGFKMLDLMPLFTD